MLDLFVDLLIAGTLSALGLATIAKLIYSEGIRPKKLKNRKAQ